MPQYELNIRDYIRVFQKRKIVIILTFLITTAWSTFFLLLQPSLYQSSTTVKIVERKSIAGLLTEWIVYDPANMMESQTKIITGFPITKKVALRLGIIDHTTPIAEIDRSVVQLQNRLNAEIIGSTNIIRITSTADTPHEAMELANTVAQVYVEENLLEKRKQASTARQFIEEQLSQLESRLREGEKNLYTYNEENFNIKLAEPLQQKLVTLEFELSSLLQKYTDRHPRVLQLQEQINDMGEHLKGFSGHDLEYAGLLREVEVNRKLYAMLKEKLEEARITEAQKVEDVSIVDPAVLPLTPVSAQKEVRILISAIGGVILGLALAFVMETLDTSVGTIEDVEKLLNLPIVGVVPSSTKFYEEDQNFFQKIKGRFKMQTEEHSDDRRVNLIVHYDPTSPIAEAYRNLRTNLKLKPHQKSILLTSASPREGKSTNLMNLGLAFAQKGLKTLLISSDLRRPVIAKTFGVHREPGLNEVLTGAVTLEEGIRGVYDMMLGEMFLEEIVKSPSLGNIWILPCGHITTNPAELLESKEFPLLMNELKERFDILLFDSPPVLSITDASLLTPKVDVVVLVYEIGKTSRNALLRAKNQLELVGADIAGVILNHIAPQSETFESYPYYSSKDYRYAEAPPEAKK
ncbi:MAG: AAA family ATPase [Candidatus Omnitrophica bacterium]|nr:AAA family ATPase [Candidatus Omnitrophota bacterium]